MSTRRQRRFLSVSSLHLAGVAALAVGVLPLGAADNLKVKAQLWTYESLCDFKDTPNWPSRESRSAGTSLASVECRGLMTTLGHPPAVRLTIENVGTVEQAIPLDGFQSVSVKTGAKTVTPVAVRRQSSGGPNYYFTTEIKGTWTVLLAPSQVVDLILLFPHANRGDEITITKIASVKIE